MGQAHDGAWLPAASPALDPASQGPVPTGGAVGVVSIEALCHEAALPLCDTLVHELGHLLANYRAKVCQGHQPGWKAACAALGLPGVSVLGGHERWDAFAPALRAVLEAIPMPAEGGPVPRGARRTLAGAIIPEGQIRRPRRCNAGNGSQGGQSRGTGSGSRSLKWVCTGTCGTIVRAAKRNLRILCLTCNEPFALDPASIPNASTMDRPDTAFIGPDGDMVVFDVSSFGLRSGPGAGPGPTGATRGRSTPREVEPDGTERGIEHPPARQRTSRGPAWRAVSERRIGGLSAREVSERLNAPFGALPATPWLESDGDQDPRQS